MGSLKNSARYLPAVVLDGIKAVRRQIIHRDLIVRKENFEHAAAQSIGTGQPCRQIFIKSVVGEHPVYKFLKSFVGNVDNRLFGKGQSGHFIAEYFCHVKSVHLTFAAAVQPRFFDPFPRGSTAVNIPAFGDNGAVICVPVGELFFIKSRPYIA